MVQALPTSVGMYDHVTVGYVAMVSNSVDIQ